MFIGYPLFDFEHFNMQNLLHKIKHLQLIPSSKTHLSFCKKKKEIKKESHISNNETACKDIERNSLARSVVMKFIDILKMSGRRNVLRGEERLATASKTGLALFAAVIIGSVSQTSVKCLPPFSGCCGTPSERQ